MTARITTCSPSFRRVSGVVFGTAVFCAASCFAVAGERARSRTAPKQERLLVETLDNGMTVVLKEKHAAPVATVQIWVKTGSVDEGEYLGAGISHFVEHMLFKGTKRRKAREFDQAVSAAGGDLNAYTSTDRTVFHVTLPAEHFELALDGLADFVRNATFPEVEFEPEKKVVLREIARGRDDPERFFNRLVARTIYDVHPYRHPVIGYVDAFKRLTREDLVTYFKRRYVPRNMTVVAVGDFDAKEKAAKIRAVFKNFRRRAAAEPARVVRTPRLTPREVVAHHPRLREARLSISFPTVPLVHPDLFALDVAAKIMGEGRSSRLYKRLRGAGKPLVRTVSCYNYTPRDAGNFFIEARLKPGNVAAARQAIFEETARLKKKGVTAAELARAKRQVVAEAVYARETVGGEAETLGSDFLLTGDVHFSERYVRRIQAVTAAEVRAAARKYLLLSRRAVVLLLPGKAEAVAVEPTTKPATKKAVDKKRRTAAARPTVLKLPGGARLVVIEDHALPAVGFAAAFLGGVRFEPATRPGVSDFMAEMLTRGTKHRSAEELAAAVENLGAKLTASGGRNSFLVEGKVLKSDLPDFLELAAEVLTEPAFPVDELEKMRASRLARLAALEERPSRLCGVELMRTAFAGHPYARPPLGTVGSVKATTREELCAFHARTAVPGNMVVSLVGDLTPAEAERLVKRAFRRFFNRKGKKKFAPPPVPAVPVINKIRRRVVVRPGLRQAVFRIAWRGASVRDADRFALRVLSAALGGMGNRLFTEVREKRGLAYVIGCWNMLQLDPGAFIVYGGVQPDNLKKTIKLCLSVMLQAAEKEITPRELARAKARILGGITTGLQGLNDRALRTALDERYELGADAAWAQADKIKAVTVADVLRVAKKYLKPDRYVVVVVGPKEKRRLLEEAVGLKKTPAGR